MSSYRGTAERSDQAKAIAGVIAVHIALAVIILSGLNVPEVKQAVEQLTTINITQPPVQAPAKPAPKQAATKKPPGAAANKAQPSPVVAPEPKPRTSSPIPAAKVPGTGNATTSGAAASSVGTGAAASGIGAGAGGTEGYTPARKLTKIPNREYRRLAASGLPEGSVAITIRVNPDGTVSNCRVVRSSGNSAADSLMCQLTLEYIRFSPARDRDGRPIAQDVTFAPNWWRP